MAAGRTRETLIALRATRAAHRIATDVALSQIKSLHVDKCRKCGKAFTPAGDGLDARTLCPGCRATPPPLSRHAARLAWFVEALCFERGVPLGPLRSAPFRATLEARGLHPRACFHVANVGAVQDLGETFDPALHPPPDLDVSCWPVKDESPPVAMRVPELWHCDGRHFHVHILTDPAKGTYERRDASGAFPFLPVPDLQQLVAGLAGRDDATVTEAFRQWIGALKDAGATPALPPAPDGEDDGERPLPPDA